MIVVCHLKIDTRKLIIFYIKPYSYDTICIPQYILQVCKFTYMCNFCRMNDLLICKFCKVKQIWTWSGLGTNYFLLLCFCNTEKIFNRPILRLIRNNHLFLNMQRLLYSLWAGAEAFPTFETIFKKESFFILKILIPILVLKVIKCGSVVHISRSDFSSSFLDSETSNNYM